MPGALRCGPGKKTDMIYLQNIKWVPKNCLGQPKKILDLKNSFRNS